MDSAVTPPKKKELKIKRHKSLNLGGFKYSWLNKQQSKLWGKVLSFYSLIVLPRQNYVGNMQKNPQLSSWAQPTETTKTPPTVAKMFEY